MSLVDKTAPLIFFFTGIANILLIKWADNSEAQCWDGTTRNFQHPLVQTLFMLLGEVLCLVIYKISYAILRRKRDGSEDINLLTAGGREFSLKIFVLPAISDVLATSLLLSGIYLSFASSTQMLRGTSIIFAGLYKVNFLNHTPRSYQWFGMLTITLGTVLICVADVDNARTLQMDAKGVLTGDLLVLCSQVFQALQLIYEEKYVKVLNIPALQAVGWEGIFGLGFLTLLMIPLNFIKVGVPFGQNSRGVFEDFPDATYQLAKNPWILVAHLLFLFSVIIYNFARVTITKNASAVNKIILNSLGVVAIWFLVLFMQWEQFHMVEFIGYLVLLSGVFIYRNVVFIQCYRWTMGRLSRRRYVDVEPETVTSQPADAI